MQPQTKARGLGLTRVSLCHSRQGMHSSRDPCSMTTHSSVDTTGHCVHYSKTPERTRASSSEPKGSFAQLKAKLPASIAERTWRRRQTEPAGLKQAVASASWADGTHRSHLGPAGQVPPRLTTPDTPSNRSLDVTPNSLQEGEGMSQNGAAGTHSQGSSMNLA